MVAAEGAEVAVVLRSGRFRSLYWSCQGVAMAMGDGEMMLRLQSTPWTLVGGLVAAVATATEVGSVEAVEAARALRQRHSWCP